MTLRGKAVAITGASGQLGRAVVEAALEAGARVAALDRAPAPANATRDGVLTLGGLDLAEPEIATQAFAEATAWLGRLDVHVNVAGTFRGETLAEGSVETWDLMYRTNVRAAVCASTVRMRGHSGCGGQVRPASVATCWHDFMATEVRRPGDSGQRSAIQKTRTAVPRQRMGCYSRVRSGR